MIRVDKLPPLQRRVFHFAVLAGMKAPATAGESWAEDDPRLPILEARAVGYAVGMWRRLRDDILRTIGLTDPAKAQAWAIIKNPAEPLAQGWRFNGAHIITILSRGDDFARTMAGPEGPLLRTFLAAWARGWDNAGNQIDDATAAADALAAVRRAIGERALEQVRSTTARTLRDGIVAELQSGRYDGQNPLVVARQLRQRFGAREYDWERLARTEIAQAQVDGKLEHYRDAGIAEVDYITAGDERVSEICRGLAAKSPYPIASAPVPGRDSHPNCRCSIVARR